VEQHPIEDGALGMPRTVNSGHSREEYPENRPEGSGGSFSLEEAGERPERGQESSTEVVQKIVAMPTPVDSVENKILFFRSFRCPQVKK
jgi:hypothetical protein